jgi:hypothetical protein
MKTYTHDDIRAAFSIIHPRADTWGHQSAAAAREITTALLWGFNPQFWDGWSETQTRCHLAVSAIAMPLDSLAADRGYGHPDMYRAPYC